MPIVRRQGEPYPCSYGCLHQFRYHPHLFKVHVGKLLSIAFTANKDVSTWRLIYITYPEYFFFSAPHIQQTSLGNRGILLGIFNFPIGQSPFDSPFSLYNKCTLSSLLFRILECLGQTGCLWLPKMPSAGAIDRDTYRIHGIFRWLRLVNPGWPCMGKCLCFDQMSFLWRGPLPTSVTI